jgi:flagellar motor protein MotB
MAHTYMLFDFGADEDKAQQARHKLEGWKQAYRLDKKLQVKFDRGEELGPENEESEETSENAEKAKSKTKAKTKRKASEGSDGNGGSVKLLVRLYFSAHEKLSEQQWLARIPTDAMFKEASPQVIREGEPEFSEMLKQFEALG